MLPPVGSINLKSERPTVVLPQPDSPTKPERLAFFDNEVDIINGFYIADGFGEYTFFDREVFFEPFYFK
jgi:hypothetical protein